MTAPFLPQRPTGAPGQLTDQAIKQLLGQEAINPGPQPQPTLPPGLPEGAFRLPPGAYNIPPGMMGVMGGAPQNMGYYGPENRNPVYPLDAFPGYGMSTPPPQVIDTGPPSATLPVQPPAVPVPAPAPARPPVTPSPAQVIDTGPPSATLPVQPAATLPIDQAPKTPLAPTTGDPNQPTAPKPVIGGTPRTIEESARDQLPGLGDLRTGAGLPEARAFNPATPAPATPPTARAPQAVPPPQAQAAIAQAEAQRVAPSGRGPRGGPGAPTTDQLAGSLQRPGRFGASHPVIGAYGQGRPSAPAGRSFNVGAVGGQRGRFGGRDHGERGGRRSVRGRVGGPPQRGRHRGGRGRGRGGRAPSY
jgi:translation initiation factor IF-2